MPHAVKGQHRFRRRSAKLRVAGEHLVIGTTKPAHLVRLLIAEPVEEVAQFGGQDLCLLFREFRAFQQLEQPPRLTPPAAAVEQFVQQLHTHLVMPFRRHGRVQPSGILETQPPLGKLIPQGPQPIVRRHEWSLALSLAKLHGGPDAEAGQ